MIRPVSPVRISIPQRRKLSWPPGQPAPVSPAVGGYMSRARALLSEFESIQAMHIADRERLERALAERSDSLPRGVVKPDRVRRIGVLMGSSESDTGVYFAAFVDELARLGWTDGRNVRFEQRWTNGDA